MKITKLFFLLRPNRSIMVAMITGAAAFASGSEVVRTLLITLAGWCLAVGGFSLDFYADRSLDVRDPRASVRRNPLASGEVAPAAGLAFSLTFIALGLITTAFIELRALIPGAIILAVITGLALHLFERPLARACTLGLLQALYVFMGASTGSITPAVLLLAGVFFFAMFGGRGMIDIRDFPVDEQNPVQTLPKRFGVKATARMTAVCLHIAYGLSLGVYLTGELSPLYLYLVIPFITIGLVCAWWFALRPSPELARTLTMVFMMGEGTLICLAVILGSL
ncbi:MAG: UbiA prenyltransferase family protein [Spirochaetaceae bacterium]|nr:MAG: UbiA prenyltransferase family protein [Spirochaetaceae bacterium]